MKIFHLFSVASITILLIMGCSTVKVVTDTKPGADFSGYKTFKVVHFAPEEAQQAQNFRLNQMGYTESRVIASTVNIFE